MKKRVYLSLGSNLGDREANLGVAIHDLAEFGCIVAKSGLYETEPVEVERPQPWFLNCVVAIETELMPRQFLSKILAIEQRTGRGRAARNGPRTLDIDIILFGTARVRTAELTIPHRAMHRRRFVLEPLAEIAPDVRHPVLQRSVRELLEALPSGSGAVRRFHQTAPR